MVSGSPLFVRSFFTSTSATSSARWDSLSPPQPAKRWAWPAAVAAARRGAGGEDDDALADATTDAAPPSPGLRTPGAELVPLSGELAGMVG